MRRNPFTITLFSLLLLVLAAGVTSCRDARHKRDIRDALQHAEALMETDPHAARAVLDSLMPNVDCQTSDSQTADECLGKGSRAKVLSDSLNGQSSESRESALSLPSREARRMKFKSVSLKSFSRKDAALYALLRTQADYKCRVRLTSDSLPLIATNYYGTKRKTLRAALAQYYLGCAYSDMNRDLDAIDALLRATTLFPDTTNKYYANTLFELGKKYMGHEMNDKAIATFRCFRDLKICEEDSVNIGYADYYLGETYLHNGDDFLADSLFHCVITNTKFPDVYRCIAYHHLAKLYYYRWNDAKSALKCLEKYNNYYKEDKHNGASFLLKADIYITGNEPSKAVENYKKSLQNSIDLYTHCSAYKGLAQAASLLNMPDSAKYYVDQYTLLLDSIYTLNRKKEIADIENNHIIELHDQQLKARHTRFLLWGGLFFVLAFSAFAITLLLNDRKRKNEKLRFEQELRDIKQRHIDQNVIEEEPEMEAEESPASDSESDVLEIQTNTSVPPRLSIQQERITLYRKQYKDSDWARYFREHQLEIRSKDYVVPKDSVRFMAYLHELFADLFLDMVNDNQELTRQDLEYSAMIMLGFNTVQMSYCARVSSHSLHNRRYRMREKLTSEWYALIFGIPK